MTAVVVILVVLALLVGVGGLLKGIAWALLIGVVLLVAAGWIGWQKLRAIGRSS